MTDLTLGTGDNQGQPQGFEDRNLEAIVTIKSKRERKRKMRKSSERHLNKNKGKVKAHSRLQECVFKCVIQVLPYVMVEKC